MICAPVKGADDESTWAIRDRRHDAPPLLWIACFRKEDSKSAWDRTGGLMGWDES